MKKAWAFVLAFFASPKNDLNKVKKQFELLKVELFIIQNMQHLAPVHSIVKLFQVISEVQDTDNLTKAITALEKKNYGQLDEKIEALKVLNRHIRKAGRSKHGYNQTKKGEAINFDNIFIWDTSGNQTKSASCWLEHRDSEIEDQIKNFVLCHVTAILNQVALIEKF